MRIGIIIDSLPAIKALSNISSTTPLVHSIHYLLNDLESKQVVLIFYWIRSNNGNQGNDTADKLSKQGAVSHNAVEYDQYPTSFLKKSIFETNKILWNEKWRLEEKGLVTKRFIPSIDDRLIIKKFFETDFYLTQILTNHGRFKQYLKRFKLSDDENCSQCNEVEDYQHVIFNCAKYDEERASLIEKVIESKHTWPCNPNILLSKTIFNTFKAYCNSIFN